AGGIAAGILVPAFVILLAGIAWGNREAVYEHFPQARAAAETAERALSRAAPRLFGYLKPGGGGGSAYGHLSLDPEELDVSPDFLLPSPLRPPGAPGAYTPLPDRSAQP
ncbi:hypothetical protein MNEG_13272, partial [Monoraphidium neglectum]